MECSILKTASNGAIVPADLLPYNSIVWEEGWQNSGTAQVVFPKADYIIDAVRVGRWMGLDITTRLMYIHSVEVRKDEVWAYGYEAKELFKKCALLQLPPAGTVDVADTMEAVISNNCPYSWLGSVTAFAQHQTANLDSLEYTTLLDFVDGCNKIASMGWYLTRNNATGLLDVYAGQGGDKTNKARFATVLGNARDTRYTKSDKNYCNTVYAVGENGIVETAQESNITGEIYSAILDLRDSFPLEDMTEAEYREALQNRAYMSLIARHTTEKIDIGEIDTSQYGTTYRLGDIVSVYIPELRLTTSKRVTLARYTIEGGNIKLKLTLSEV